MNNLDKRKTIKVGLVKWEDITGPMSTIWSVQMKGVQFTVAMGSVGGIFHSIVRSLEYHMIHKLAIGDWVL